MHVVVGELGARAQRPAGRKFLVEGQRGGRAPYIKFFKPEKMKEATFRIEGESNE